MIDTSGVCWSEDHDAYTMRFDENDYPPSVAVAETIETALDEHVDPLFDYLDPDALDGLVGGSSTAMTVTFDIEEATVTIHGDGRVFVRV